LPPELFLTAAAFVELSLGALLWFGVLGRPLAAVITLVFFLTTMVFGKQEVVGHLILHGVLLVFLLEGTSGTLRPPFRWHKALPLRLAFVGVNFVLFVGGLLFTYQKLAEPRSMAPVAPIAAHATDDASKPPSEVSAEEAPNVRLTATRTDAGGWRLAVEVERFHISSVGKPASTTAGAVREGHAHLLVDGEFRAMIFSNRHELAPLPPGQHEVRVQLSTPDHRPLHVDGRPVEGVVTLEEPAVTAAKL
jgi:hypothetical protein